MVINRKDTNVLKGIAIIFVILGHLGILKYGTWEGGLYGVAIFLVLSGYGIQKSYENQGLNKYWLKKFEKIYLPYIILIGIEILVDISIFHKEYSWKDIVSCVLCKGDAVDGTLWYIFYLFLFYFAFWFICLKKIKYCSVFLLIAGIVYATLYVCGIYRAPVVTAIYFPFFSLGSFLATKEIKISKENGQVILTFGLCAAVLLIYMSKLFKNKTVVSILGMLSVYPFIMFIFILVYLESKNKKKINCSCVSYVLEYMGKRSFTIYLFEGILITKYTIEINNIIIWILAYLTILIIASQLYNTVIDFCICKFKRRIKL